MNGQLTVGHNWALSFKEQTLMTMLVCRSHDPRQTQDCLPWGKTLGLQILVIKEVFLFMTGTENGWNIVGASMNGSTNGDQLVIQ